ncbi:septum formation protein Maf [Candidatus Falkowbacteria bacterium]|jgi:septum formation protein|nr:septum formation protein Maf [Candidatus Falkowbacteria bacterium]MBT5503805.1 septum formation protein Maf [Candidatus Falkowbacteria bacterium]MBT7348560.1 septum formation protein Maf [Candidatus Falkowbacteria bacterium]MBT7501056.1 septum formation protein Maf [Candidatus Falkowbacteria bacterium]
MKKIILASTSPRRKEIMAKTRLKFKVVASDYEEDMSLKMPPLKLAKFLSKGKADSVAKKYRNHLIIGADTFVVLNNKLLGKPSDIADAKKMLKQISGKVLLIVTGYTIIDTGSGKSISKATETKVHIKKLKPSEIINYVKSGEPLDKAGAFGVQELGAVIIKKIEGDFYNVMGLPIFDLSQELKKFGVNII